MSGVREEDRLPGNTTTAVSSAVARPRRAIRDKEGYGTHQRHRKKKLKHTFADYCAPSAPIERHSPDPIAFDSHSSPEPDTRVSAWLKTPVKSSPFKRGSISSVPESDAGIEVEQLLPRHDTADSLMSKDNDEGVKRDELLLGGVKQGEPRTSSTTSSHGTEPTVPGVAHVEESIFDRPAKRQKIDTSIEGYVTDDQAISEELSDSDTDMEDLVRSREPQVVSVPNVTVNPTDVLVTPKSRKSTKKVLIFAHRNDDDEDELVESPSRRASSLQNSVQVKSKDSARKQLFTNTKSPVQASPVIDGDAHVVDLVLTPTKVRTLKVLPTPVKQPLVPRQTPNKSSPKKKSTSIPVLEVAQSHVDMLKYNILVTLTERKHLPLVHRDAQYTDVHTLLRETILRSESNSALLIGQKSTGKSLLIETALKSFQNDGHEFLVVRLDGLVQTDDRMALKAIATQLQPDNEEIANADIMTALLAILSHPREFGETDEPLSTVILLDHFEQFTEHPRQTLLYNLFDIAQSKKAPICVLGLTNRVNSYDALEKRVKSRFSHRVIQFPHLSLEDFASLATSALLCTLETDDAELQVYRKAWNEYMSDSQDFYNYIKFVHLTTTNIRDIFATFIPLITVLGTSSLYFAFPPLTALLPTQGPAAHLMPDSKLSLVPGLSLLELGMLVSAARLEIKGARINMMTTVDEHTTLVQRSTIAQRMTGVTTLKTSSNAICAIAWQTLLGVGLLVPQAGRTGAVNAEFRGVKVEVRLESIAGLVKAGKLRIGHWMNSWLTL